MVTTADLRDACAHEAPSARVLINPYPHRGMTSSLKVADAAIEAGRAIAVVPCDKPFLQGETIARCESVFGAAGTDVVYPEAADGRRGHPVYFGRAARARLERLEPGDTLHRLRDDPALRRTVVSIEDDGAFEDLDTPRIGEERRLTTGRERICNALQPHSLRASEGAE